MPKRSNRGRAQVVNVASRFDPTAHLAIEGDGTGGAPEIPEDDRGPTTVYYLYDTDRNLLYVGITLSRNGLARFHNGHSSDKSWWTDVAYAAMKHSPTRRDAEIREAQAIETLNPRYNIARPKVYYGPRRPCACGCGKLAPKPGHGATRAACRQREHRVRSA